MRDVKYLVAGLPYANKFPSDPELIEFITSLNYTYFTQGVGFFHLNDSNHVELMLRYPNISFTIWDYETLDRTVCKHYRFEFHPIKMFKYNLNHPDSYTNTKYLISNYFI